MSDYIDSAGVDWGYPLDLADITSAGLDIETGSRMPWRRPGETQAEYIARIVPFYPDQADDVPRWYDVTTTYPEN
jgi:hypothetical protein